VGTINAVRWRDLTLARAETRRWSENPAAARARWAGPDRPAAGRARARSCSATRTSSPPPDRSSGSGASPSSSPRIPGPARSAPHGRDSVRMALDIQGDAGPAKARDEAVADIFRKVGLRPEHRFRYPHELSGGQPAADRHRPCADPEAQLISATSRSLRRRVRAGADPDLLRDLRAESSWRCCSCPTTSPWSSNIADASRHVLRPASWETAPASSCSGPSPPLHQGAARRPCRPSDLRPPRRPVPRLGDPPDPGPAFPAAPFRNRWPDRPSPRCSEHEPALAGVRCRAAVAAGRRRARRLEPAMAGG